METWFYDDGESKKGPFLAEELKDKINKDTLVWSEGMKEWKKAKMINVFQAFFPDLVNTEKQWFYVENDMQKGPLFLEELKEKITKDSLVWCKGMQEWEKAQNLKDFDTFFSEMQSSIDENTPPPIPITEPSKQESSTMNKAEETKKNDSTNGIEEDKDITRIRTGIIAGIVAIVVYILGIILFYSESFSNTNIKVAIFNTLVIVELIASIIIYLGLKSYFSGLLKIKKIDITINWMIALEIVDSMLGMFLLSNEELRYDIINTRPWSLYDLTAMPFRTIVGGLIIFLLQLPTIILLKKIFDTKASKIYFFKIYALIEIIVIISIFFSVNLFSSSVECIAYIFLIKGLQEVRKEYGTNEILK